MSGGGERGQGRGRREVGYVGVPGVKDGSGLNCVRCISRFLYHCAGGGTLNPLSGRAGVDGKGLGVGGEAGRAYIGRQCLSLGPIFRS